MAATRISRYFPSSSRGKARDDARQKPAVHTKLGTKAGLSPHFANPAQRRSPRLPCQSPRGRRRVGRRGPPQRVVVAAQPEPEPARVAVKLEPQRARAHAATGPAVASAEGASWRSLGVPPKELRLAVTLLSGQAFLWERRTVCADGTPGRRAQFPADCAAMREAADEQGAASAGGAAKYVYVGAVGPYLYVLREEADDVAYRLAGTPSR